jgi:hypothetical protein
MTERTDQIGAAEIKDMTPEQIAEAFDAGRLDEYMGRRVPEPEAEEGPSPGGADQGARGKTYANTRERLRDLSPAEIDRLHKEGALDAYMRGEVD